MELQFLNSGFDADFQGQEWDFWGELKRTIKCKKSPWCQSSKQKYAISDLSFLSLIIKKKRLSLQVTESKFYARARIRPLKVFKTAKNAKNGHTESFEWLIDLLSWEIKSIGRKWFKIKQIKVNRKKNQRPIKSRKVLNCFVYRNNG